MAADTGALAMVMVEFRGGPLHGVTRPETVQAVHDGIVEHAMWAGQYRSVLYERMPAEEVYRGPCVMCWIILH